MIPENPRCWSERFIARRMCAQALICGAAGHCVRDRGYDPYNSADSAHGAHMVGALGEKARLLYKWKMNALYSDFARGRR